MKENDLRYIKTERAIREAFFALLEEGEFEKITVKDITERALINRNTFYLHYKDKFDLINSILVGFIQDLSTKALEVIDASSQPDKATFDRYFVTIFVNANKVKKRYRIIFKDRNIEPYLDMSAVTDVIKQHIEANKYLNHLQSSITKSFLAFGFFGALNEYCTNDYSTEETSRLIAAMSASISNIVQKSKRRNLNNGREFT